MRAALLLSATGTFSAASVHHTLAGRGPDIALALGVAAALLLMLGTLPRRPIPGVVFTAFVVVAVVYLSGIVETGGAAVGFVFYVFAAAVVAVATPAADRPLAVAGFALWTPALRVFGPPTTSLVSGPLAIAAFGSLALLVAVLVRRDGSPERLARIGLVLLTIATVATVVERHLVVESTMAAPDDVMALVLVAAVAVLLFPRVGAHLREALAFGLVLATWVFVALALLVGKGYHVDTVIAPHRAAELFLAGEDPYRSFDFLEAATRFGIEPALVTHYLDGSQVRMYDYPALSFLIVTPFVGAGLTDVRWVYVLELVLLLLYLRRRVDAPWRSIVAATVVGNVIVTRQYVLAGVDPTWAVLAVVAWVELARRNVSPVALGLALASRQTAWFLAPFYVLAVARRDGWREALRRGGLAAVVALVPNLPFLIDAPGPFLVGVLTPLLAPLEPDGVGFVRFALAGALPPLSREVHAAFAIILTTAGAVILWVSARRPTGAAPVLALLPLYFAWRSLQSYFAFLPVFAFAADEEVVASGADASPS